MNLSKSWWSRCRNKVIYPLAPFVRGETLLLEEMNRISGSLIMNQDTCSWDTQRGSSMLMSSLLTKPQIALTGNRYSELFKMRVWANDSQKSRSGAVIFVWVADLSGDEIVHNEEREAVCYFIWSETLVSPNSNAVTICVMNNLGGKDCLGSYCVWLCSNVWPMGSSLAFDRFKLYLSVAAVAAFGEGRGRSLGLRHPCGKFLFWSTIFWLSRQTSRKSSTRGRRGWKQFFELASKSRM